MGYRYRRIDVRKGRLFWQARPVRTDEPGRDQAFRGLDLVPMRMEAETWWHGFTRQQAIARAYRWAKRQNRRDDRAEDVESIEFGPGVGGERIS